LDGKLQEHELALQLCQDIRSHGVNGAEIILLTQDTTTGYDGLPSRTNALQPTHVVTLHLNAAPPAAKGRAAGYQGGYWQGSTRGWSMLNTWHAEMRSSFGPSARAVTHIPTTRRMPLGGLLGSVHAPCIYLEPYFIDNPAELARYAPGAPRYSELIAVHVRAFTQFARI
jgi:hypothetical protein